ncbi:hypothetical protein [Polymorphospora sp. NPDC050346]|uniref:hypothetical protein n=1 Tax=Polymorphospora sp. NPDC050346 TaxID=3155780 RepID=UPI0033F26DA5
MLSEPEWAARLSPHDPRGLTPLFWSNVLLHGTVKLDLNTRASTTTPTGRQQAVPGRRPIDHPPDHPAWA